MTPSLPLQSHHQLPLLHTHQRSSQIGSITLAGRQIFILNENDRYPEPQQNSPPMFAIRDDEEGQHWLYVWHKGRWPLVSGVPFETQGKAVDAAIAFNFATLYSSG